MEAVQKRNRMLVHPYCCARSPSKSLSLVGGPPRQVVHNIIESDRKLAYNQGSFKTVKVPVAASRLDLVSFGFVSFFCCVSTSQSSVSSSSSTDFSTESCLSSDSDSPKPRCTNQDSISRCLRFAD